MRADREPKRSTVRSRGGPAERFAAQNMRADCTAANRFATKETAANVREDCPELVPVAKLAPSRLVPRTLERAEILAKSTWNVSNIAAANDVTSENVANVWNWFARHAAVAP